MTREEFIEAYTNNTRKFGCISGKTLSELIALPCACGESLCKGWAMVFNDPESIAAHNELYGPRGPLGCGEDCWREAFEDGDSPADAIAEDMDQWEE